jgi:hypothetical protein
MKRGLNAFLEAPFRLGLPVQTEQGLEILIRDGPPIRKPRQGGKNVSGAGLLVLAAGGLAHEELPAAPIDFAPYGPSMVTLPTADSTS